MYDVSGYLLNLSPVPPEDVFGTLDWSRRDLGALNIQRGRDMGLPGYNKVREAYGLERISSWEDINTNVPYTDVSKGISS